MGCEARKKLDEWPYSQCHPAPIPYAVDPHTVEQAWFMASRWSAPLYERPGRHGPRLLGSAWVDGVRDGSHPTHAPTDPQPGTAPPLSRCRPIPRRRHRSDRGRSHAAVVSWPSARCCARGTGAGRAGAGRRQERRPGRGPGRAR
ncbi:hypothetical protein SAVERM_3993 [Streptomyces avermitilis MA-4680 = NBRC 14893]|uniref:Uncharacterized protein n=1 Tax=Streptomyces avermitilis (strain ATCC 31267 / DSM 46492 / JCM 5070 / NBRC 14893 / NCIMB 12804 / NRRL 8165 / MA-4680) TaxID=227882 RepID=Q82GA4_STRAW|nr:hypothetical protein SAVERM_3993 [Streptomyces avermitilis MA-4680 = NBRC 14893]